MNGRLELHVARLLGAKHTCSTARWSIFLRSSEHLACTIRYTSFE